MLKFRIVPQQVRSGWVVPLLLAHAIWCHRHMDMMPTMAAQKRCKEFRDGVMGSA